MQSHPVRQLKSSRIHVRNTQRLLDRCRSVLGPNCRGAEVSRHHPHMGILPPKLYLQLAYT